MALVVKIWNGTAVENTTDFKSGTLVELTKNGLLVKTGDGGFLVTEIQARGGKRMAADAYLRGTFWQWELFLGNRILF